MTNRNRKIAILTSGGDAPGMNKVIESLITRALDFNIESYIIKNGFLGLCNNEIFKADYYHIKQKASLSGSMIFCSRFSDFSKPENLTKAINNLKQKEIDCLFVLGGNGSMSGASLLVKNNINVIGIPCTIDMDVNFSDYSIGFDSALNAIADTLDLLKNTARSHGNIFLVELMGRNCSSLTLATAYINNVDYVITPFNVLNKEEILSVCQKIIKNNSRDIFILITERLYTNEQLNEISDYLQDNTKKSTKIHIMGFIQRGAKPTGYERYNATRMAYRAIELFAKNKFNFMIGLKGNEFITTSLDNYFHRIDDDNEIKYLLSTINKY